MFEGRSMESLDKFFKLEERKTTILTELRAGAVTFFTMGYILAVNALILSDSDGPCESGTSGYDQCKADLKIDLIYATAISAGVSTLLMGLTANLPLVLAPGMGLNAYFTYSVVGFGGSGSVSYENALFATFIEGFIFLALSITGVRSKLMRMIPRYIKYSMTAGIGLFLAHLGLQSAEGIGLITQDGATLVTLGGCGHYNEVCDFAGLNCSCPEGRMEGITTWIGIIGFMLMSILMIYRVRGAIFIGILLITISSWFRNTDFTYFPYNDVGNSRYEYFKQVVDTHIMETTPFVLFNGIDLGSSDIWVSLLTFLYIDILDSSGTLFSMADFAGIVDETGSFEGETAGFCADAIGTIFGALLGTSTVTTYIESGAGIEEGGRTGLTAITAALFFFASLLFSPIFASIPAWATGPALIIVGSLMMKSVMKIDWNNMKHAIPSFVTIIIMPLSYSIAYGIIAGLMTSFVLETTDYLVSKCKSKCKCLKDTEEDVEDVDEELQHAPEKVELAIME